MNFNYPQLTVFSFLVLSYTATYVGGQCNLICWYIGNIGHCGSISLCTYTKASSNHGYYSIHMYVGSGISLMTSCQ